MAPVLQFRYEGKTVNRGTKFSCVPAMHAGVDGQAEGRVHQALAGARTRCSEPHAISAAEPTPPNASTGTARTTPAAIAPALATVPVPARASRDSHAALLLTALAGASASMACVATARAPAPVRPAMSLASLAPARPWRQGPHLTRDMAAARQRARPAAAVVMAAAQAVRTCPAMGRCAAQPPVLVATTSQPEPAILADATRLRPRPAPGPTSA